MKAAPSSCRESTKRMSFRPYMAVIMVLVVVPTRPNTWSTPSARRAAITASPAFIRGIGVLSGARVSSVSALLDHVDVGEHVEVDVAVDHQLALPVLLDPAHRGLARGVADDPGHRHVAHVGLHDLLGLRVVLHPLLDVARVAPGFQLLVEGLVGPGLAL